MGGVAKALLARGDRTFLQCILATANADDAVVVVGPPFGAAVAAHAIELGARVIENPDPDRGMASSVSLGFAALAGGALQSAAALDAAWLWPVDHPDVRAATLDGLVAALGTHDVAQPRHGGRGGHPPLIRRRLFAQLAGCTTYPEGARSVISKADVIAVEVDDAGTVEDVDR
jgi:CTP:molybdopterin cytidylyltransferase MocA